MVKKRIKKSEQLPKYGTVVRSVMVLLVTTTDSYRESIEKGYPLFTKEELYEIKNRYEAARDEQSPESPVGLTWDDIRQELERKKIFLKKVTFRKYIQDGYLPDAIGYRSTNKARVAIFPSDTISHINFIQYFYKVANGQIIDELLEEVSRFDKVSFFDAVESFCTWRDNLQAAIYHDLVSFDDEARSAIEGALAKKKDDQRKALAMLSKIRGKFEKHVETEINKLIDFLKNNYMAVEDLPEDKKNDSVA